MKKVERVTMRDDYFYDKGYEQGRADAERDFQNSDYWNDYLAKVIADARADERAKIVDMIDEISFGTLYCMADMCDRADKNCEKCALEYVIKRIKEQKI